jgi:hypothetical protein
VEKEVLKDHWQLDLEYALGQLGSLTIFVGILLGLGKLISLL